MTTITKPTAIDAYAEELAALAELLGSLDPQDWSRPTPCPGWSVHDQAAHIIGIESSLVGVSPSSSRDPVVFPSDAGGITAFNDQWLAALAQEPVAGLLDRLTNVASRRLVAMRAMDQASWDEVVLTPAGRDSYGRFMRIRVFDCWVHEQDIRDATGRPGHESGPAVDLVLDETLAALGFIVGKRAAAPAGATVTLDLTGPAARTVHVAVAERAAVVDQLDDPATVTLSMPVGTFTRLSAGRVAPQQVRDQIAVAGDTALGDAILQHLAFTI